MIETLVRTFSFVRKEVVDVVRQPMLVLALIVGPFLILLAFGAGLRETDPPLHTALVVSEESEVREEVERFANEERDGERLVIEGVSSDREEAMRRLRDRELELVIVFPDEVSESVEQEEQAVIDLYHNQIDPVEGQAIRLFSRTAVDEVNDRVLTSVVADLQEAARQSDAAQAVETSEQSSSDASGGGSDDSAEDGAGSDASATDDDTGDETDDGAADETAEGAADEVDRYLELDPAVVVSPFRGEVDSVAGRPIELTDFYAPAVVVVLLQHLAVTLLGLSVVRERALGAGELFRVSPLRTSEYLLGKFFAYLVIGGVVGAVLLALLVFGLGVPMAGSWWQLAAALGVLLFTATALGLVLSLLARTDSQAVQYAMLVLLATIFLSGFLLSLERFVPLAQPLPWILPATYGIEAVRDVMLRGADLDPLVLGGLGLYGVVFMLVGASLAHRKLNSPGL